MKTAEQLIEIESLLENLLKSQNHDGGVLRMKVLFFCNLYQNLSVGMIIQKLGIKKTNFASMLAELEAQGCVTVKRSNLDKRCRLVELTDRGKGELNQFLKSVDNLAGSTTIEVDKAIDTLSRYLNKNIYLAQPFWIFFLQIACHIAKYSNLTYY